MKKIIYSIFILTTFYNFGYSQVSAPKGVKFSDLTLQTTAYSTAEKAKVTHAYADTVHLGLPSYSGDVLSSTTGGVLSWVSIVASGGGTSKIPSFSEDIYYSTIQLGKGYIASTLGLQLPATSSYTMASGTLYIAKFYVPKDTTITKLIIGETTAGSYTANNFNGVGIYTIDIDGNMTEVAVSSNQGAVWTVSNGQVAINLSSPYRATKGLYCVGLLYSSSAQTTAPVLLGGTAWTSSGWNMYQTGFRFCESFSGQTTMPSSIAEWIGDSAIWVPVFILFE